MGAVRIPIPYILSLARETADECEGRADMQLFRQKIDHWLLVEILNCLGSHSML